MEERGSNESVADETGPAEESQRPRRRRRSREDVEQRIHEAARDLFAERGYAAATTREIALRADVSETLLFRYHGDKAGLFAEVVTRPFNRLMEQFTALSGADPAASADAMTRQFTEAVFRLFEDNETLFRTLLLDSLVSGEAGRVPGMGGILPFFDNSVDKVAARYAEAGLSPPLDLPVGVRLGFGMILSSVLLRDALFDMPPARDKVLHALQYMVSRTLTGPLAD